MIEELVVCSLEPWDEVWRRNQFLVAGLLDVYPQLRVLFVELPTDPLYDAVARRRPSRARGLRHRTDVAPHRLWTYQQTKLLPRSLGPLADRMLTAGVARAARRIGMRRPILWVNDPSAAAVMDATGWPTLYDITDDWVAAVRSVAEHDRVLANEERLMTRAKAVVVCSTGLLQTKGARRPVELIGNAVDVARFRQPQPRPADLPRGPVIVYVGTLHEDRLDVDLCVRLANQLDGRARLVLVGPNALSPANNGLLESTTGLDLLGARPNQQIPGYLQHADVLVVPHVVDGFTDSLDPIKLYEYRAVGRPIVSTPVAGFRDLPGVVIADGAGLVAAVSKILSAPADPSVSVADDIPTWAERVETLADLLERIAAGEPV